MSQLLKKIQFVSSNNVNVWESFMKVHDDPTNNDLLELFFKNISTFAISVTDYFNEMISIHPPSKERVNEFFVPNDVSTRDKFNDELTV